MTVNTATDSLAADEFLSLREAIAVLNDGDPSDGVASLGDRTLTAGELAQVDVGEPFGTNDTVLFDASLDGTPIRFEPFEAFYYTISTSMTIRGNGRTETIIDGADASRLFYVAPEAGDVTFDSLTLTNGFAGAGDAGGAAIVFASAGTLTILDSAVANHHAQGDTASGGAIVSHGSVVVRNSDFNGNSTAGDASPGGAIAADGNITVVNSTFSGNSTTGNVAMVVDVPIASGGGALFSFGGTITIVNSTLSGNSTAGDYANGAAVATLTGDIVAIQSTFSGNHADGSIAGGGAIYTDDGAVTIVQSTITGNHATTAAGGIAFYANNQGESLTLLNSIIAGNTAGDPYDFFAVADFTAPGDPANNLTVSHSLIGNNQGTTLLQTLGANPDPSGPSTIVVPGENGNLVGFAFTIPADPLLGPLQNNGGFTPTHAPLAGSPVIDRGDTSLLPTDAFDIDDDGDTDELLPLDQRGASRVRGEAVDIGAVEKQNLSLIVDNPIDEDDGDYSPGDLSLREAVALANANPNAPEAPDEILFSPSVNSSFFNYDTGEYAGPMLLTLGQMTITESVVIRGNGRSETVLDAQGNSRHFDITHGDVTFQGVTLRNGRTTADDDAGGAIRSQSSGTLTILDSDLNHNQTEGFLASGGAVSADGDVSVRNSTFDTNATAGGFGGAIHAGGDLTASDSRFTGNSVANGVGGAIEILGNVEIVASAFVGNRAVHGSGGAIVVWGDATIVASELSDNFATFQGGAVFGGGLTATVFVVNSTLSGNEAGANGGALFLNAAATEIIGATIVHNTAGGRGGGVVSGGNVTLRNSIVALNSAATSNPDLSVTGTLDVAHSLIGDNSGTTLAEAQTADAQGNFIGTSADPIDPRLGPLQDNGGGLRTHALLAGSLARDTGDATALPADTFDLDHDDDTSEALPVDQRVAGFQRVVGDGLDMGAFEDQTPSPRTFMVDNETDEDDGNVGAGDLSLREAVRLANERAGSTDTIVFATALNGTTLVVSLGDMAITDSVTIRGNGAAQTVLDAHQNSRFFRLQDQAFDVTFEALTLQNGRPAETDELSRDDNVGGAIASFVASESLITIRDAALIDNSTVGTDAGFGADGGAIFVLAGGVRVERSTLSGNYAQGTNSGGGVIYSYNVGAITIVDSTLSGNSTRGDGGRGGAIYQFGGQVTISGSTLSGNWTEGANAHGGALYDAVGHVTVTNSTLSGNETRGAGSDGGAILFRGYFYGAFGGGITDGSLTVVNSTLTLNQAANAGGAIFADLDALTIHNSIVAGNNDNGTAPDLRVAPASTPTVRHSLIGDNAGSNLAESFGFDADGNLIGSAAGAGVIDPHLAPLADNGGPTQTHALLPTSFAINLGDNALAVDVDGNSLTSDQRGGPFSRVFGGVADIGAYEFHPHDLVVDNATDEDDGDYSSRDLSLREAVRLSNADPAADTITFAPELNGTPILLDGTTFGDIEITDSVTITGNGAAVTVIDGQQRSRLFQLTGEALEVTFDGLAFQNGRTAGTEEHGGAILWLGDADSTLNIRNSEFTGNSTAGTGSHGGAVDANFGVINVSNSTFSGNFTEGSDGLGAALGIGEAQLVMVNSTISGNTAQNARAGGIYSNRGRVLLVNSTIVGNSATRGGGLWTRRGDRTVIRNSIIAGNTATEDSPDILANSAPAVEHSLIGHNEGTGLSESQTPDLSGNYVGGAEGGAIDPMLGELADNGGPTRTHTLLAGSLAIDHGSNALAVDPANEDLPLTTDQRGAGFLRILGGTVDMGAAEAHIPRTFVVDNATDEDDGDYSTDDLSLREAVRLANENSGAADSITFAPKLNGTTIFVTLGQMTITESVVIQGNGRAETVIDAAGNSRFFHVSAGDLTLERMTLQNGRIETSTEGGGAVEFSSTGTLTVRDSLFFQNSAIGGPGNIPSGGGAIKSFGNVVIVRSTFDGNRGDGGGGAINGFLGTLIDVSDSFFTRNSCQGGGGAIDALGDLVVRTSALVGNTATGTGGAIEAIGDVTVIGTELSGNSAETIGGAIWHIQTGLYNPGSIVRIVNSTLSGNRAGTTGGLYSSAATVQVVNSTIVRNQATTTLGGVGAAGHLDLQNSIVAQNVAADGINDVAAGSIAAAHSLIGDNQGSGLAATGTATTPGTNGNFIGTHAAPIDPGLGELADNGGPTRTHALLPGSLALNRGSNALAVDPSDDNAPLAFDQRGTGFARIVGPNVDIGAFESLAQPPQINAFAGSVFYPASSPPIVLDADATVSDLDSTNFDGGNLTIALTANAQPTDRLGIRNEGRSAGQIGVIDDLVVYGIDVQINLGNGQVAHQVETRIIGRFTGGDGANPLVVTFNANATIERVQALLRNITFQSTVPNPSLATRTVTATLTDDTGWTSDTVSKSVTLAVSNPPVIRNFGPGVAWVEGPNAVVLGGILTSVVDSDSPNFDGGTLTVALTNNAQPGDVLSVRNQGLGAGKIGVALNTVTFGGVVLGTFAGGTNGAPLVITFTSTSATATAVAALLKNITFNSTSDNPTNATRTVSATLFDGDGGTSLPVTKTIRVSPVNDAPLLQSFHGQVTFTEDGPPVALDADATVVDADSPNFDRGVLQATASTNGESTDRYTLKNGPTAQGGVVTTNGADVLVDAVLVGTIKDGPPHATLTILFNANATAASVTAVVQALQFHNVSNTPKASIRTVQITLTDGDNGSVVNKLKTVRVMPVNDAPTIGGVAPLPNFAGQPQLLFGAATLADPDSAHFNGGTLTLQPTGGFQTGDRLGIRNQGRFPGQIGVSGANITYGGQVIGTFAGGADGSPLTITFTTARATLAAVQALLRNLTFTTTSNILGPRTLTATLREFDGTASNAINQTVNRS